MFAARLKELRAEKGLSQSKLAEILCVSKQNVSDWENEKSETNFDMLAKIASFFGVSADYMLGLEN